VPVPARTTLDPARPAVLDLVNLLEFHDIKLEEFIAPASCKNSLEEVFDGGIRRKLKLGHLIASSWILMQFFADLLSDLGVELQAGTLSKKLRDRRIPIEDFCGSTEHDSLLCVKPASGRRTFVHIKAPTHIPVKLT
jgi:hypothetical protein